jgi:hypothetical protein
MSFAKRRVRGILAIEFNADLSHKGRGIVHILFNEPRPPP